MKNLMDCQVNQVYRFEQFKGEKEYGRHLVNLGMVKGVDLYVVSKEKGQPVILVFKETRIGLDEMIAKDIYIVEKENNNEKTMKSLDNLPINGIGTITKILGTGPLKRHLMDMGLTKGTKVQITKYAPLGDPIEIKVRNYELTLRKKEAEMILIESELD